MTWVKIDDRFEGHPKVIRAGYQAIGVYILALTHSAGHLTNGHVSPEWVKRVAGGQAKKMSDKLVSVGLWEPNGDGWTIHDYFEFNPSRETVLEKRRQERDRKSR